MSIITGNKEIFATAAQFFLTPKDKKNLYQENVCFVLKQKNVSIKNYDLFVNLYGLPKNQFAAVKWVLTTSNLTGIDRLVAATIAGFYNPKQGYCYPTQQQIAEICGISERTVNTSIKQMKLTGEWLITPTKINPYEKTVSNQYYLLPPAGYGVIMQGLEFNSHMKSLEDLESNSLCEPKKTVKQKMREVFASIERVPPGLEESTEISVNVANHYSSLPQFVVFGEKESAQSDRLVPLKGKDYRQYIQLFTHPEKI